MACLRAISIHAPRTGSDQDTKRIGAQAAEFQSTLPARGATSWEQRGAGRRSISIHAPRTGSDAPPTTSEPTVVISIHAPRTGSDGI